MCVRPCLPLSASCGRSVSVRLCVDLQCSFLSVLCVAMICIHSGSDAASTWEPMCIGPSQGHDMSDMAASSMGHGVMNKVEMSNVEMQTYVMLKNPDPKR